MIARTTAAVALAILLASSIQASQKDDKFVAIFDGKTLAGWQQRGGKAKFAVEDGAIVGTSVPNTPNSFLCTAKNYSDFILELEFKIDDGLNSGVQIRSNSIPSYKNGQVHGYQVEIDPSNRAWTGGIYDEGRRGWLNDLKKNEGARKAFKHNDWNKFRIEFAGDSIKTWINGVPAADTKDGMTKSGFIALQVHGVGNDEADRHVRFRNIRLKELAADQAQGFVWESPVPADCPFERSKTLTGVFFTGRHSNYQCGDTWYPCWASDGNLYSPWTDGATDNVGCGSGEGAKARTAHAVMIGDDPLKLTIHNTSPPKVASALPYKGRYPCGSLVYNGVWYYGTYCLGADGWEKHEGVVWNWPNLGPMPGFQISRDYGKTWTPSPLTPEKPLFPEPSRYLAPVKMGAPHFIDFGKNMEHSPDGKAYVLAMGAEENDPKPRPCLRVGKRGEGLQPFEGCKSDFAHANLSWITADQVYLARVKPSPETINDVKAWEFFAGHDAAGQPQWTNDFAKIKPLVEWNNHMGCVTATYVPGLKKYLMCVTDGWPTAAKMTSYILEADAITGPWRMVSYMKNFGEQGYFLNFPSKFMSTDGRTLWLCYSANFSPGWNGVTLPFNPAGGRYGLCLHELKLLAPGDVPPKVNQDGVK